MTKTNHCLINYSLRLLKIILWATGIAVLPISIGFANFTPPKGHFIFAAKVLSFSKNVSSMYLARLSPEDWMDIKVKMPPPEDKYFEFGTHFSFDQVDPSYLFDLVFNVIPNFSKKGLYTIEHGQDKKGHYIEATGLFYTLLGKEWVGDNTVTAKTPNVAAAMSAIFSAAARTWGYTESQAEKFSRIIVANIIEESLEHHKSILDSFSKLPKYGVRVRRLESGNLLFYSCPDLDILNIQCQRALGLPEGFSQEQLKKLGHYYRLKGKRIVNTIYGGIIVALESFPGFLIPIFGGIGVSVAGGTLGGMAVGSPPAGFIVGLAVGVAYTSFEFVDLWRQNVIKPTLDWTTNNFSSSELINIAELNVPLGQDIYFFFNNQQSIREIETQLNDTTLWTL